MTDRLLGNPTRRIQRRNVPRGVLRRFFMAHDAKRKEIAGLVRWLKRKFPPALPVRVGWHATDSAFENKGAHAETVSTLPRQDKEPHGHLIRVRSHLSIEQLIQAILDEWAHILRTQLPIAINEDEPHDAIWGAIYAAIWTAWTAG